MPRVNCSVIDCSNGTYKLNKGKIGVPLIQTTVSSTYFF